MECFAALADGMDDQLSQDNGEHSEDAVRIMIVVQPRENTKNKDRIP